MICYFLHFKPKIYSFLKHSIFWPKDIQRCTKFMKSCAFLNTFYTFYSNVPQLKMVVWSASLNKSAPLCFLGILDHTYSRTVINMLCCSCRVYLRLNFMLCSCSQSTQILEWDIQEQPVWRTYLIVQKGTKSWHSLRKRLTNVWPSPLGHQWLQEDLMS